MLAASYTRSTARLKLATVACWPTRRWMAASYTKRSMRQVDSMLAAAGVYQCGKVGMVACMRKRICPIQSQLEWQRLRRSKASSGQYSGLHLLETIFVALVANVIERSFAVLKRVTMSRYQMAACYIKGGWASTKHRLQANMTP